MLTITDADRSLAAELGLFLVPQPATDQDRADALDPRATRESETWLVRSALTRQPVGRLRITTTECLYASKYAAGISGMEESVAAALRWIAPLVRHVRTGEHDGTEVVRRFGSTFERPRALTECGAKSTSADHDPIGARSELINGRTHEMCPTCRKKLEERGTRDLSHLSDRRGSSSPRQQIYIRALLDEGACNGRPYLVDARGIAKMSSREASATIDQLKALKERNWKGAL